MTTAHLQALTGELNLAEKDIDELSWGDFASLTKLVTLRLPNNDLETLPAGIFDDLASVTFLNLGNNDLGTLPAGSSRTSPTWRSCTWAATTW